MPYQSEVIRIFSERGYIHQATDLDAIDAHAATSIIPTYIGFDCTADSLHVGSLLQIMMLRVLQRCGHNPIVLMGGGTTKVGDPSGKDSARPLLSDQDIETNKNGIKKVFEKYLSILRCSIPVSSMTSRIAVSLIVSPFSAFPLGKSHLPRLYINKI